MILGRLRHSWPRTLAEARALQERLRARARQSGGPRRVRLVAGADLAYRADGRRAWAAVVVVAWPELDGVETVTAAGEPRFPYERERPDRSIVNTGIGAT
jgi:deoxyribonuclease V